MCVLSSLSLYRIKGILLQCVDPVSCIMSSCLCNAVSRSQPPVSRDTALHKQRDVIQLTGSTHCSVPVYTLAMIYNDGKIDKNKCMVHNSRLLHVTWYKTQYLFACSYLSII